MLSFFNSKIPIALSGAMLAAFYFQSMEVPPDVLYLLVTGLSIFLVYRYASKVLDTFFAKGLFSMLSRNPFPALSLILWFVFMATYGSVVIFIIALISSWLMAAYFIKIPPFTNALTKNRIAKPLVTGLVFSLLTTAVPLLISDQYLASEIIPVTAGNLFFITSLALLFDLYEIYSIQSESVHSRIRNYKRTAFILLVLAGACHAYAASSFIMSIGAFAALGITYGFTSLLIFTTSPARNTATYYLLTDGMMVLPWVLWQWM